MALQTISIDLRALLVSMLFKGEPGPTEFFVGLSQAAFDPDVSLTELEAGELAASSYVRQKLVPANWLTTTSSNAVTVNSDNAAFLNMGDERWAAAVTSFVSTKQMPNMGGVLLGSGELAGGERILAPGDMLRVPIELRF